VIVAVQEARRAVPFTIGAGIMVEAGPDTIALSSSTIYFRPEAQARPLQGSSWRGRVQPGAPCRWEEIDAPPHGADCRSEVDRLQVWRYGK